jgi:hypothetical protein
LQISGSHELVLGNSCLHIRLCESHGHRLAPHLGLRREELLINGVCGGFLCLVCLGSDDIRRLIIMRERAKAFRVILAQVTAWIGVSLACAWSRQLLAEASLFVATTRARNN